MYFFYLAQQITVIKVQLSGFSLHIIKHGQHGEREGVQTDLLEASHAKYFLAGSYQSAVVWSSVLSLIFHLDLILAFPRMVVVMLI